MAYTPRYGQAARNRRERRGWKRSQNAPARAESEIARIAGNRCHVIKCSASSTGHFIRIRAKLNSRAEAPTNAPLAAPFIGATRLTAHASAIHGAAASRHVEYAHMRPVCINSLS